MPLNPEDLQIDCATDRPEKGMWHTGPNPVWVEVTHLPTMMRVRAYGERSQHRTLQSAMACLEMLVDECRLDRCSFPERVGGKRPEESNHVES